MGENEGEGRQPYWGEVNAHEKCQRLRVEVKILRAKIALLEKHIRELDRHKHTPRPTSEGEGEVSFDDVCAEPYPEYTGIRWANQQDDEVYF